MKKLILLIVVLGISSLFASSALAVGVPDVTLIIGGGDADPNPPLETYKPWLSNGQTHIIETEIFVPQINAGDFAGTLQVVHILDNQEADIVEITSYSDGSTVGDPFGPPSSNIQSSQILLSNYTPSASNTGNSTVEGGNVGVGQFSLVAKNTSLTNSDIDYSIDYWAIYHIFTESHSTSYTTTYTTTFTTSTTGGGITTITSTVTSIVTTTPGAITLIGLGPNAMRFLSSVWTFVTQSPISFSNPLYNSSFVAIYAGHLDVGIQHVPEPASGLLVGMGLVAFTVGGRARARRRRNK